MLECGKEGSILCIITDEMVGREVASLQCSCIAVKALQIIRCCKATAGAALLPQPVLACLSFSKRVTYLCILPHLGFSQWSSANLRQSIQETAERVEHQQGVCSLLGGGESSFPTGTACNWSLFTKAKEKRDFGAFKWVFSLKWTLTVLGFLESPDNITVANQFYSSAECHGDFIRLSLKHSSFCLVLSFWNGSLPASLLTCMGPLHTWIPLHRFLFLDLSKYFNN